MINIETEIAQAVSELRIPPEEFARCDTEKSVAVIKTTKRNYVSGSPVVWWFALRHVVERRHFPDGGFRHISDYIPASDKDCWFIPELHEAYPLVYEAQISQLECVIGNCIGFAYYIVGKDYGWLLAESDSDELFFSVYDPAATS